MEDRKLIFSEYVKHRERKRIRNFTLSTIVIGLIVCVLIIPLLELKSYENDKDISQKYIRIAEHIWNNGISGIEYNELSINILDTNIEYESIYTEGICSVFDKVQVIIYIDNIRIIQKLNSITIHKGERKLVTLKFINDRKEEIITRNRTGYWIFEVFFIIFYIFLAYIIITSYKSAGNKRIMMDMNKKY